jgi:hypothetical protein
MKKISVEQAINSGSWFDYKDDETVFRVRFVNFRQVQLSEIEHIENIDSTLPIRDGKLFLLSIELINLSKEATTGLYISILDNENCRFDYLDSDYLTRNSDFARRNKLRSVSFMPKFKYNKDYIYLVPNEETKYYLSTRFKAILTEI